MKEWENEGRGDYKILLNTASVYRALKKRVDTVSYKEIGVFVFYETTNRNTSR